MQRNLSVAATLAVLVLGCSPYAMSPPARMLPLEAAKSLSKGDFAVGGSVGGGGEVWGPILGAGTIQGRYGVGRGVEVGAELGFAALSKSKDDWEKVGARTIFAGRAGFKYEAVPWFAVQAGFGGGGVKGSGGYVSPDAGVIFSYQGERVVPFLGVGFYYSVPIRPREIVFTSDEEVRTLRADDTFGYFGNLGLRIPVTSSRPDSVRSAFMFAYRVVAGFHQENEPFTDQPVHSVYHLGVFAFDLVFRKREAPSGTAGSVRARKWGLH